MAEMRALTVQQPFAWAIAYGGKDVENRMRRITYRRLLAIHAGLGMHGGHFPTHTPAGRETARVLDALGGRGNCWEVRQQVPGVSHPKHPGLALGAVIALAEVTGCHHAADCGGEDWQDGRRLPWRGCSPWAMPGQWHITLASVRPLREPVPCRGALGLWRLPEDVEKAVREQLEVASGG
jgi:hypothetical protein